MAAASTREHNRERVKAFGEHGNYSSRSLRSITVATRTRAKNEVHAVPARRLKVARRPATCSVSSRHWLAGLELPVEERETVDAGVRHIAFLDGELAKVERVIALQALDWPDVQRLMTVPGVNVIVAATLLAAVGDIH